MATSIHTRPPDTPPPRVRLVPHLRGYDPTRLQLLGESSMHVAPGTARVVAAVHDARTPRCRRQPVNSMRLIAASSRRGSGGAWGRYGCMMAMVPPPVPRRCTHGPGPRDRMWSSARESIGLGQPRSAGCSVTSWCTPCSNRTPRRRRRCQSLQQGHLSNEKQSGSATSQCRPTRQRQPPYVRQRIRWPSSVRWLSMPPRGCKTTSQSESWPNARPQALCSTA